LDKKLFVIRPCEEWEPPASFYKDPKHHTFYHLNLICILISYMIRQLSPMRFCHMPLTLKEDLLDSRDQVKSYIDSRDWDMAEYFAYDLVRMINKFSTRVESKLKVTLQSL
jgi:hypothetical protein